MWDLVARVWVFGLCEITELWSECLEFMESLSWGLDIWNLWDHFGYEYLACVGSLSSVLTALIMCMAKEVWQQIVQEIRTLITLGNRFLVTNCFWGKISHFLLISRRWARIWQWKLEIDYGFWGIRKKFIVYLRNMYMRHVTIKVRFYLRLRFACRLCSCSGAFLMSVQQ